jgi:hypothetical protein
VTCQFAHGVTELRSREFDSKYKSELCLLFGNRVAKADGSTAAVEDLEIGDRLQGQGGRTVKVVSNDLTHITSTAYRISVASKQAYTVTPQHRVTLAWKSDGIDDHEQADIFELSIDTLLKSKGVLWGHEDPSDSNALTVRAVICPVRQWNDPLRVDSKSVSQLEFAELLDIEEVDDDGPHFYAKLDVLAEKPDNTEADHRFLLADGQVIHNCKNYYLFGPSACFFASRCKFIRLWLIDTSQRV